MWRPPRAWRVAAAAPPPAVVSGVAPSSPRWPHAPPPFPPPARVLGASRRVPPASPRAGWLRLRRRTGAAHAGPASRWRRRGRARVQSPRSRGTVGAIRVALIWPRAPPAPLPATREIARAGFARRRSTTGGGEGLGRRPAVGRTAVRRRLEAACARSARSGWRRGGQELPDRFTGRGGDAWAASRRQAHKARGADKRCCGDGVCTRCGSQSGSPRGSRDGVRLDNLRP